MPKPRRRSSTGKPKKPVRPCTYELGYVRQDLYACTKCTAAANGQLSGFCRGCRETCHADHPESVFELYTKRAFRCDCGNTRARNVCHLFPDKDDLNIANERSYGHNFVGRYCRCDTPYDPRLEMAQCAMCEDWFHQVCFKTDASRRRPANPVSLKDVDYELVCRDCASHLPVLAEYYEKHNIWDPDPTPYLRSSSGLCSRPTNPNIALKPGAIDLVWIVGFRRALCRCPACRALYAAARASYIIDRGDFVGAPAQDDLAVLNATDDAEIVEDVLYDDGPQDSSSRKRSRDDHPMAGDRIPRKAPDSAPSALGNAFSSQELMSIRSRISSFLKDSIESNGGSINPDSLRGYLSDLKADLMASVSEKLRS